MTGAVDGIGKVIVAGQQARRDLAVQLAQQFQRDPQRFDPRRLEQLGAMGLRQFLETVGTHSPAVSDQQPPNRAFRKTGGIRRPATGWAALRRPERSIWIGGAAAGLRAGAIAIAFGLFVLVSVEKIIPVVREMLS
jgi:hypothetical protein